MTFDSHPGVQRNVFRQRRNKRAHSSYLPRLLLGLIELINLQWPSEEEIVHDWMALELGGPPFHFHEQSEFLSVFRSICLSVCLSIVSTLLSPYNCATAAACPSNRSFGGFNAALCIIKPVLVCIDDTAARQALISRMSRWAWVGSPVLVDNYLYLHIITHLFAQLHLYSSQSLSRQAHTSVRPSSNLGIHHIDSPQLHILHYLSDHHPSIYSLPCSVSFRCRCRCLGFLSSTD